MKPEDFEAVARFAEDVAAYEREHPGTTGARVTLGGLAFDTIRRVAEAIAGFRWIPVTEQLPKRFAFVLVAKPHWAGRFVATHSESGCFWSAESGAPIGGVTHWMPLPAPPEPTKND